MSMRYLNEVEAKAFLAKEGIPVNPTYEVGDIDEAKRLAEKLGYPVVLKVSSSKVIHKSDIGGVVTNIANPIDLEEVFLLIKEKVKGIDPDARLCIQPHLKKGIELVVGVSTDSSFGKVIMFGVGGIWIEVFRDVAFRLIPIKEKDALQMIEEIKAKSLLDGLRGYPPVEKKALCKFLMQISDLAQTKNIKEMDLNPVFAWEDNIIVADARLRLE